MRKASVYEVECLCGATVTSESVVATCGKCGRVLELHWRIESKSGAETKTISERYEAVGD